MEASKSPKLEFASIDLTESESRAAFVRSLSPGAHVHLSAICGTGMAAVGVLLKELGFRVTGSDKAFYPPMGDVVRTFADKLYNGYSADNLSEAPAFVVIGNNLSRANPEVEHVLDRGIPYASMPEVFSALLIGTRAHCPTSIVISGTHGKTTTSAAVSVMLDRAGRKPGYFIGGMPCDLSAGIRAVDTKVAHDKRCVVLEGDEYDSAFFAKWAKFHSYRPDIAVVTSLEFDHADIYRSISEIEAQFNSFVRQVPKDGTVLVSSSSKRLLELGTLWQQSELISARVCFYGQRAEDDFQLLGRTPDKSGGQKLVFSLAGKELEVIGKLSGEHNALNLLSAASVGSLVGLAPSEIASGLGQFSGVLRRQQVVFNQDDILVIEDFAHHPTAVRLTLRGLKESYPKRRLIAVYEPRSNTSRRAFFQKEYPESFRSADLAVIFDVLDTGGYSNTGEPIVPLDVKRVISELSQSGVSAESFSSVEDMASFLTSEIKPNDLVVVMSNGDFGGLKDMLLKSLLVRAE